MMPGRIAFSNNADPGWIQGKGDAYVSRLLSIFDERGVVHPGRNDGRGNYHSDERKGDKQIMHL
jgi:hypothetical protein